MATTEHPFTDAEIEELARFDKDLDERQTGASVYSTSETIEALRDTLKRHAANDLLDDHGHMIVAAAEGAAEMRERVMEAVRRLAPSAGAVCDIIRRLPLTPTPADPLASRITPAAYSIAAYLRAKGRSDDAIVVEVERYRASVSSEEAAARGEVKP